MARPARSGPGRDAGRWTGRGARRLAQALFRVAAFVGPARGQRIGRLDVLRKIDLLPVEPLDRRGADAIALGDDVDRPQRSEENTSELQSLMRISYAVFCLKKKRNMTINSI